MLVCSTELSGLFVLEPEVFEDSRGHFFESYNARVFKQYVGRHPDFVQDNCSRSRKGVLRGLHYQVEKPQDKLITVMEGSVFDVAVDIRRDSPTFGKWFGTELSARNKRQIWIPKGFAHGFLSQSELACLYYKTTDFYFPAGERTIRWDDAEIGIDWPLDDEPVLSRKDMAGVTLDAAEVFS